MGMPTVVGVSASAVSGTGAVTPAFPSGYSAVADDIGLIWGECDSPGVVSAPSGWAIAANSPQASGTTTRLFALWRRLQAGDSAPSVSLPSGGNHQIARMIVLNGCVTTGNPWDIAATSTENVSDTSVSIPGVTTTAADCLILAGFATGRDVSSTAQATGWANAALGSVTEQMDNWTNAGNGGGFAMASGTKAAAGATGATTATVAVANFKAHLLLAMKGAAAVAATSSPWTNRLRRRYGHLLGR